MAHRGLALTQPVAQVGDVKFAVGRQGEIEQNAQARLVAQELEDLSKFANGLIRHFRSRRGGVAIGARYAFGFFFCHGCEPSSFLVKNRTIPAPSRPHSLDILANSRSRRPPNRDRPMAVDPSCGIALMRPIRTVQIWRASLRGKTGENSIIPDAEHEQVEIIQMPSHSVHHACLLLTRIAPVDHRSNSYIAAKAVIRDS